MRSIDFKNGTSIVLEPGMEYSVQEKTLRIYDTRFDPELERTFFLSDVLSFGDTLRVSL
jgi:hypothetical protein